MQCWDSYLSFVTSYILHITFKISNAIRYILLLICFWVISVLTLANNVGIMPYAVFDKQFLFIDHSNEKGKLPEVGREQLCKTVCQTRKHFVTATFDHEQVRSVRVDVAH